MPAPEWFFSTVAQSTAAIAGLIIAFTAVLYQLERRRREGRTEELRNDLIQFRERYEDSLLMMATNLLKVAEGEKPNQDHITIGFPNVGSDTPQDEIYRIIDETSAFVNKNAGIYSAVLFKLIEILQLIGPSRHPLNHYLLTRNEFESLRNTIQWTSGPLRLDNDFMEGLMEELDEIVDTEEEVQEQFYQDYFSDPGISPSDYVNPVRLALEEVQGDMKFDPSIDTGMNLRSFNLLLVNLRQDFQDIDAIIPNTLLGYSPGESDIVYASAALLLIGVFLPTALLFSIPSSFGMYLSEIAILGIQVIIVSGVCFLTFYLLYQIMVNLSPSS